jgi:hypothetical protein
MLPHRASSAKDKPSIRVLLRLMSGEDWAWLDGVRTPPSEDVLRAAWATWREPLIQLHRSHVALGRPYAYWHYDLGIAPPLDGDGETSPLAQNVYLHRHTLHDQGDPPVDPARRRRVPYRPYAPLGAWSAQDEAASPPSWVDAARCEEWLETQP